MTLKLGDWQDRKHDVIASLTEMVENNTVFVVHRLIHFHDTVYAHFKISEFSINFYHSLYIFRARTITQ